MDEARYRQAERDLWRWVGVIPTEHRVHLQRNEVTVRLQEVGEGPTTLFVHGANVSGSSWASLAGHLQGFRCIILDRPGTGLSDAVTSKWDAESLRRMADSLVIDVLDALGVDSANVVATSFGGYIALRSGAEHPDRIARMVQFSWPVGAPITHTPASMRLMTVPGLGRMVASIPPSRRAVRMMFRQIGHADSIKTGRISTEIIDWWRALLRDTRTMRNEIAMGKAFISPLRGIDDRIALSEEFLSTIRIPTRFIWGENDPFGGAETARRIVDAIPNAELAIMSGAGHAPWLDDLAGAARSVSDFLHG